MHDALRFPPLQAVDNELNSLMVSQGTGGGCAILLLYGLYATQLGNEMKCHGHQQKRAFLRPLCRRSKRTVSQNARMTYIPGGMSDDTAFNAECWPM